MDTQDTHFVKFLGKANIPEALEIDKSYKVQAEFDVTDIKRTSNQNGEYDLTYTAKPTLIELVKANGERIKAKDPRRNSQRIRQELWKHHFEEGVLQPFDEVYTEATWVIMFMMPTILKEAVRRLEIKENEKNSS